MADSSVIARSVGHFSPFPDKSPTTRLVIPVGLMKHPPKGAKTQTHEHRTSNVQHRTSNKAFYRFNMINPCFTNRTYDRCFFYPMDGAKRSPHSILGVRCSMFDVLKTVAGRMSRRTGPNLFGPLGHCPRFKLLQSAIPVWFKNRAVQIFLFQ
jgi:hypothetical protein